MNNGTEHMISLNFDMTGDSVYRVEIKGLFAFTNYNVSISGCTIVGCGPENKMKVLTNEQGNLFFYLNLSSISQNW